MSKQSRRPHRAHRPGRGQCNERAAMECMLDECSAPATWALVELIGMKQLTGVAGFEFISMVSCEEHADDAMRTDRISISGPIEDETDYRGLLSMAEEFILVMNGHLRAVR